MGKIHCITLSTAILNCISWFALITSCCAWKANLTVYQTALNHACSWYIIIHMELCYTSQTCGLINITSWTICYVASIGDTFCLSCDNSQLISKFACQTYSSIAGQTWSAVINITDLKTCSVSSVEFISRIACIAFPKQMNSTVRYVESFTYFIPIIETFSSHTIWAKPISRITYYTVCNCACVNALYSFQCEIFVTYNTSSIYITWWTVCNIARIFGTNLRIIDSLKCVSRFTLSAWTICTIIAVLYTTIRSARIHINWK